MIAYGSAMRLSMNYGAFGASLSAADDQSVKVGKAWWALDWSQRKLHPEALLGAGATVLTLANGAKPTFVTEPLEYRATIKGGLMALARAGISPWAAKADAIANLPTKMSGTQKNSEDDLLTNFVGLSGHKLGDLKKAAVKVREMVIKAGLGAQAWGYRGLFLLQQEKILEAIHGAVVGVLNMFPPTKIAAIIGAAHGAAESITSAGLNAKFTQFINAGDKAFALGLANQQMAADKAAEKQAQKDSDATKKAADAAKKAQQKALAAAQKSTSSASYTVNPLLIFGGVVLLGGGLLAALKWRST